jgi:hypothetical protein
MHLAISARWGIRIMAGWAAILSIVTLSRLLLISEIPQSITTAPIWLLFAGYVAFAAAFTASAYALWQRLKWGRFLFIWLAASWAAVNIVGLILPVLLVESAPQPLHLGLDILRHLIGGVLPVVYLNLASIRPEFEPDSAS